MVSIKEYFSKFKKNRTVEHIEYPQIYNISDLIRAVNKLSNDLNVEQECEIFLQSLIELNPNDIVDDSLLKKFLDVIEGIVDEQIVQPESYIEDTEFQRAGRLYMNYSTARLEKDGSYSISAILSTKQIVDYIRKICLLGTNESIIDGLKKENKQMYENLLHNRINTYYGSFKFIKLRSKCIMDAIKLIKDNYQLLPDEFQMIEMKMFEAEEIIARINSVGNVIIKEDRYGDHTTNLTQDEYLDVVAPAFKELVEIEEELAFISQRLWENYFNQKGAKFVHALTGRIIESDRMPKICATLYMDDLATIPYGHTGYEYGVSMENIDCICENDAGSWRVTKQRFLEQGISHSWQWNEETCMFYEEGYYSKLLPPDYIEMKARKYNQGIKNMSYTEILLLNNGKKIKPVKAFCTDKATEEEINLINQMAELQGIEVEYIDTKAVKNKMEAKGLS